MVVTDTQTIIPPPALMSRVSWGAIFAGAVCAVALTALLSLLGLGIGFGSLDPAEGDSVSGVPKATLIWWAIISVLATGIGGFVAARLAGIPRTLTGALHGLAVWSVATLLTLWLATTAVGFALGAAANLVSSTARVASSVVTTAGGAAVSAGGALVPSPSSQQVATARNQIMQEATALGRAAGMNQEDLQQAQNAVAATARDIARTPGDADQDIARLIDRLFQGPNAAISPAERERLVTEISRRSGVSRGEAERIAGRWENQANTAVSQVQTTGQRVVNQAGETAVQVSDDALDVMSKVAWGMFLISLAGLVAAIMGAALGAPSRIGVAAGAAGRDRDHYDDHDHVDLDR